MTASELTTVLGTGARAYRRIIAIPMPILVRLADRGLLETSWSRAWEAGRPGTCTG